MSNIRKFNVRQFRNLLFSSSIPFPQTPKLEAPKFSTNITFLKTILNSKPFNASTTLRRFSTSQKGSSSDSDEFLLYGTNVEDDVEVEPIELWEEEDEAEPELGDGGDGGGVNLQNCSWGERALSLANEVLHQFDNDLELFAFKTSPKGYIYVRIDKLSTEYGCPKIEVLEEFNRQFKKMLDEAGESGELPDDLGLDVSSAGALRLLKVPDDLERFKHMPMTVNFTDDSEKNCQLKTSVFYLEAIDTETESCTWKLADVKENRDPAAKGRPFSRKQKDWRLQLPFANCQKVMLYIA